MLKQWIKVISASLLISLLSMGVQAQSDDLRNLPGYFNFGQIPGVVDNPKVQIDLNPVMLGLLKGVADSKESEAAEVLAGLQGVRVFVYELTEGQQEVMNFINNAGQELESDGWMRMVYVEDKESSVRIHVKPNGGTISGLTVMVLGDDSEAVFINVIGDINPAELGKIAGNIGIGDLIDDISEAVEEVEEST